MYNIQVQAPAVIPGLLIKFCHPNSYRFTPAVGNAVGNAEIDNRCGRAGTQQFNTYKNI